MCVKHTEIKFLFDVYTRHIRLTGWYIFIEICIRFRVVLKEAMRKVNDDTIFRWSCYIYATVRSVQRKYERNNQVLIVCV